MCFMPYKQDVASYVESKGLKVFPDEVCDGVSNDDEIYRPLPDPETDSILGQLGDDLSEPDPEESLGEISDVGSVESVELDEDVASRVDKIFNMHEKENESITYIRRRIKEYARK